MGYLIDIRDNEFLGEIGQATPIFDVNGNRLHTGDVILITDNRIKNHYKIGFVSYSKYFKTYQLVDICVGSKIAVNIINGLFDIYLDNFRYSVKKLNLIGIYVITKNIIKLKLLNNNFLDNNQ